MSRLRATDEWADGANGSKPHRLRELVPIGCDMAFVSPYVDVTDLKETPVTATRFVIGETYLHEDTGAKAKVIGSLAEDDHAAEIMVTYPNGQIAVQRVLRAELFSPWRQEQT